MNILVCVIGRNNEKLIAMLKAMLSEHTIFEWPSCECLESIEFVITWNAPDELWTKLPNLKVVQSYGAGVDNINFELLPKQVNVTRIVDDSLAHDMAEYILTHVLAYKLRLKEYYLKQQIMNWKPRRANKGNAVGILGMGELGHTVAQRLIKNDFKVSGWSRTSKLIEDVMCFYGDEQLPDFLKNLDYLICLLPLTKLTKGILNYAVFDMLPDHCVVLNVGRGEHLVESDLITALNNQQLRGACLDVFTQEPMPHHNPLWSHPNVTITPHCAAITDLHEVCIQITHNALACSNSTALLNKVDKDRGY